MARPRKKWSHSVGRYGARVRIYEPALGAPLRWDYRGEGGRHRPEVDPALRVRTKASEPVDPVMEKRAIEMCEQKHAALTLAPLATPAPARRAVDPATLTVEEAFALYHDPRRNALPKSRTGRTHHTAGRKFWQDRLGKRAVWNDVPPADIEGALADLIAKGQVATAVKRLQTLRTMARWLQRKMRIRGLEDPTIGIEVRDLSDGYTPRRPRLAQDQIKALRRVLPERSWRTRLFYTLLIPSGTRAIQARTAMRSMLDAKLEPPPPAGFAPHGWIAMRGVKGQRPHVTYFTARQRAVVDEVIAGPLASWEAEYQAGRIADYPLLPAGRIDRDQLSVAECVSDRILRYELRDIFKDAGIAKKKNDRIGFHAVRRAWADLMHAKEGLDTTTSAGGWSRGDTVDDIYLASVRHSHLERARQVQEGEDD